MFPVTYVYPTIEKADIQAGVNGFVISGGLNLKRSHGAVSDAGDVNGDGLDDLILGAPESPNSIGDMYAGKTFIVFGKTDGAPVDLSNVGAGAGGFVIEGYQDALSGAYVSAAGDFNADGLDDVLLGIIPGFFSEGAAFLVFGKTDSAPVYLSDLFAQNGGFAIEGHKPEQHFGVSVSKIGDLNGDGFDDVLIGARELYVHYSVPNEGRAYVIFGKSDSSSITLQDIEAGTGGYVVNGIDSHDSVGQWVSHAGDVNADGTEDFLVYRRAGGAFVVFGKSDTQPVELSTVEAGSGGFVLSGGHSGTYAGDVNGDGFDDIIMSNGNSAYIAFGKADTAPVELSEIEAGLGGYVVNGVTAVRSVDKAGDQNGDGLGDVIIQADGACFVVFGKTDGAAVELTDVAMGIGGFGITVEGSVSNAGDVNGDSINDFIIGVEGEASYVVFGGVQAEPTIFGTEGDDKPIIGTVGNETIYGLGGNDVILGGPGADHLDGGAGTNTAKYSTAASGVTVQLLSPGNNTSDAQGDTYIDIQNIEGSEYNDDLRGDNSHNSILSHGGNDIVYGYGGNDKLFGGDGDDLLIGGIGSDILDGGPGEDRAQYHQGAAGLIADLEWSNTNTGEAAGDSYSGIESLFGTNFGDQLRGDDLANQVSGYGGDDTIHGRGGTDILFGGDGDDFLIGGTGVDTFNGGPGKDRVQYNDAVVGLRADLQDPATNTGGAAGETYVGVEGLLGSQANDTILGDQFANDLFGYYGNDIVFGRGGDDILRGNEGADKLNGGAGDDILLGGAGIDTFRFDGTDFGTDRIIDFDSAGEMIDLTAYAGLAFGDLTIVDVMGRAEVSFSNGEIVLAGILAADVEEGWFAFAP